MALGNLLFSKNFKDFAGNRLLAGRLLFEGEHQPHKFIS